MYFMPNSGNKDAKPSVLMNVHRELGWLMIMMMIIFIHKKYTLQIMANYKQQSPNLIMPIESNKKNIFG